MPEPQLQIYHPNRDKAESKATKATIVLLLLISVAMLLIIIIGGWSSLQGALPVTFFYIVLYLVMAFFISRWNRGLLPVACGMAVLLAVIAGISAPEWFARDEPGFAQPALDAGLIGLLSIVLLGIQALLVAFTIRGFTQQWNIEIETASSSPAPPSRGGTPDAVGA